MRIGFLVNSLETERGYYTTVRLAMQATNMGHEAWFIGVGDLAYDPGDYIRAWAKKAAGAKYKLSSSYLKDLLSEKKSVRKRIAIEDLDVLLLRNDPATEPAGRGWARGIGVHFGRIAAKHGVIVLNDPNGLSSAMNKMYFQQFPEEIRPITLITRNRSEIKEFVKKHEKVIVKPLSGSGGKNVFIASKDDIGNINQIIDAVSRDGYVVAQEFLSKAKEGDIRLFLMNGVPLVVRGKYAAFRRIGCDDDIRSNSHVGGKSEAVEIDGCVLQIAEAVRPKLVQDGMFLVGLDIVGEKVIEVNVFSPGGLGKASRMYGVNFMKAAIKAMERKVKYMNFYRRKFNNTEMATL